MFILKTRDLVKSYSGRTVVDHVSYDVAEGEIVALLGRNGAGKSTSFRMTMGMVTADSGQVIFNGQDVSKFPMYKRSKRGMGYLAQEPSIFRRLTVYQNLMAILETRPLTNKQRRQRAEQLMAQFDLTKNKNQHALSLSGGEKRKLEIARALVCEPFLILLDEPFAGVDPIAVDGLKSEITRLREEHNVAILITDHDVERTLEIADRAYVIFEGKVFANGTPKEIVNNAEVRERYTGSLFKGDEFD